MAFADCCRWSFLCWSQAWNYHFIHGTYGSILTTEGWAVVDYVGNDLVLQFGRGVEVVGAEAQNLWNGTIALSNGATTNFLTRSKFN